MQRLYPFAAALITWAGILVFLSSCTPDTDEVECGPVSGIAYLRSIPDTTPAALSDERMSAGSVPDTTPGRSFVTVRSTAGAPVDEVGAVPCEPDSTCSYVLEQIPCGTYLVAVEHIDSSHTPPERQVLSYYTDPPDTTDDVTDPSAATPIMLDAEQPSATGLDIYVDESPAMHLPDTTSVAPPTSD